MKYLSYLLSLIPFVVHGQLSVSPLIDVQHYDFRIEVNDSTDLIKGTATIRVSCKNKLNEFELDFICKSGGKGMEVEAVKLFNQSLKFAHQNDRLKITLPKQFSMGDQFTFEVIYGGVPKDGLIISKNKYGDRTFFADNWPNRGRNWLPIVDHPADKASVNFTVIAPLHYEVVSNGIRIEETYLNKKQKLTRYEESVPISTKVMVIGIARFAVERSGIVNSIPVESWVYPQNRTEGFGDYAAAVRILDFFNSHIGPYSYQKLANVQSKTTFGGLENASTIFYSENSVTGKNKSETLIAHEIAHQWFGNAATEKEWSHLWLSEGFATYFALLFNEYTHGIAKRQKDMIEDRDQVIAYFKKQPASIVDPSITDLMKLLNVNNYQKGGWVLHMLRQEIGDANFWNGIREYYREFQFGNALTNDLQRIMETASGKDLKGFFDQWVFKPGYPVIEADWIFDEKNRTLRISVNQTQKTQIFSFPLEIGIFSSGSDLSMQVERAYIDKESQEISIPSNSKPLKIVLDPNINLLFDGTLKN